MAPDKFEKHIREKIREREIAPSEEAWNRIAGLIPAEERKRSRPFLRYSLAASFAGLLIIALYLMQSRDEGVTPAVQVVETEQQLEAQPQPKILPQGRNKEAREEQIATRTSAEQDKSEVTEGVTENEPTLAIVTSEEAQVIKNDVETGSNPTLAVVEKQEEILQAKITEVVAEVRLKLHQITLRPHPLLLPLSA